MRLETYSGSLTQSTAQKVTETLGGKTAYEVMLEAYKSIKEQSAYIDSIPLWTPIWKTDWDADKVSLRTKVPIHYLYGGVPSYFKGNKIDLIIYDEYKGEDMGQDSTACGTVAGAPKKKLMSPVLENLVDFAYRAGESEGTAERLSADVYKAEGQLHQMTHERDELIRRLASSQEQVEIYFQQARSAQNKLDVIEDKALRARAAARKALKKPVKKVAKKTR